MVRSARFAIVALALCSAAACDEKKRSPPLNDQTVEITLVTAGDAGLATNAVMIGETAAFPLPAGDTPAPDRKPEMRAAGVYVVTLKDGFARPVYLGLGSLFFGPRLSAAEATRPITYLAGASVAWNDRALRKTVIQVTEERALGELPALLATVADRIDGTAGHFDGSPDPIWRATVAGLSAEDHAKLAELLEPTLHTPDADTATLRAAALVVDLAPLADVVAARLRGALTATDRIAAAILLRSTMLQRPTEASAIACTLLIENPRVVHGDALLGAALLAARSTSDAACQKAMARFLVRDACEPDARCKAGVPVGAESDQNEPPCTREEALLATTREAEKPKEAVADMAPTTVLALSAAYELKQLPAAFLAAHARRRYAIEAKGPACSQAEAAGTPCTATDTELRLAACQASTNKAHTDTATFVIDPSSKKLRDVRALKAR